MLLPILLLQLAQSATPASTVVVVTRRTAVSVNDARTIAALVNKTLVQAGVQVSLDSDAVTRRLASLGVKDSSGCQGRKACVQEFGRQLDAAVVIGVSISEVDTDRSLALEAVRVDDGVVLAHENLLYARASPPPPDQLGLFATHTREALSPTEPVAKAPPSPSDAPTQPVLEPTPAPSEPVVVAARAKKPSHTGALVVGAGALVALGAAVALEVLAVGAKADLSRGTMLPDGRTASALTGGEATSISKRANAEFFGGVAAAVVGVGLGATAVVIW